MTLSDAPEPRDDASRQVREADRRPRIGERVKAALATSLAWFFGVLLILGGFGIAIPPDPSPLSGALLIIAGLVLLPVTRSWIHRTIGLRLTPRFTGGAIVVLVIASGIAATIAEQRSSVQSAIAADSLRRENLRARFDTAATAILASMQWAIDSANYRSAIAAGEPYRFIGDQRLDSLYALATERQQAKDNRAREQQLLAQVRQVPATDLEQNRSLYGQLMNLNPDQPRYRERFNHYNQRIREQEAQAAERRQRFGDPPQASAWDGTYREVREYLKRVMNDPESLEMDGCTPVYHTADGWLVGCDYRGRNAFGGMVRQSNWFIIRRGVVVDMKEASAYRP